MRILLDECLPRNLAKEFEGHQVSTSTQEGWAGKDNGELLRRAAERFDVFVTADQNLQYQQNLEAASIAVVVLVANRNTIEELKPLVPEVCDALGNLRPGEVVRFGDKEVSQ